VQGRQSARDVPRLARRIPAVVLLFGPRPAGALPEDRVLGKPRGALDVRPRRAPGGRPGSSRLGRLPGRGVPEGTLAAENVAGPVGILRAMDFELTEEQALLKTAVRQFAEETMRPRAAVIDQSGQFPKDLFAQSGELGLAGVSVPPEYGGAGMDVISYSIVIEEISRVCANMGVILSVNNSLVCDPIEKYGNDDQKKRFLEPLARGEKLGCFALTEPNAGSDAANQQTRAVLER